MSGENEILNWIRATLEERGCEILVEVNEDYIFADPAGREWKLSLLFCSNPRTKPYFGDENTPDRLRRLAAAYEARS